MNTLQVASESPWLLHFGAAAILYLHIAGGTVGILSGTAALTFRKGSWPHRLAGHTFFVSMLVMAGIGAAVAPFLKSAQGNPKMLDALMGLFTCYLVVTGWLTVRRKAGTIGRVELVACAVAFLMAAGTISFGLMASASADGLIGGYRAAPLLIFGGIIALAASLDLKVILQRGVTGTARLSRHVWRMGLAVWIAFASFFLGLQRVMPESIQGSLLLFIPPLAVLVVVVFWLAKLPLSNFLRQRKHRRGQELPSAPAAVEAA